LLSNHEVSSFAITCCHPKVTGPNNPGLNPLKL
jgi:hypothetical protein